MGIVDNMRNTQPRVRTCASCIFCTIGRYLPVASIQLLLAGRKSSFVFFMTDVTSEELPFLIVLRTIDVHSELRRNPIRKGGLTGLQRKPSEVALIKIQSIRHFRINIPN